MKNTKSRTPPPIFILSKDKREIIIATAYYSRGQRGERVDVVEVWDADTLSFKYEIPISEKRASALNYEGLLRLSADGRWLFVQNATPATSVTVVDMVAKKDVGEISMPGCWAIYPAQSNSKRFAALCGEGNVTTVTLTDSGQEASRTSSGKFFDPDNDAWFMQGEQYGDRYHFVSFKGNIATVNVGGETAVLEGTWPLVTKADQKKAWRPGGYQPLAVHAGTNRLYVTMHSGGVEGSHKTPQPRYGRSIPRPTSVSPVCLAIRRSLWSPRPTGNGFTPSTPSRRRSSYGIRFRPKVKCA